MYAFETFVHTGATLAPIPYMAILPCPSRAYMFLLSSVTIAMAKSANRATLTLASAGRSSARNCNCGQVSLGLLPIRHESQSMHNARRAITPSVLCVHTHSWSRGKRERLVVGSENRWCFTDYRYNYPLPPTMALQRLRAMLHLTTSPSSPPLGLHWRSSTIFIIATVGIGLFTDLFLYGLVVPILPFILQDRVGIHDEASVQAHVSGLLAAYAGASVLFSPVAGVIADKTSTRQLPFLVGLASLFAATAGLFLGKTVAVLVVARVLQGISAAVVWTIGLALCLDTVGPENLGKTIGSIFSFISVGELAAPVLGGVLYEKAGYVGVFGIGFAILAVDFGMRLLVVEKKVAKRYMDEKSGRDAADGGQADGRQQHYDDDDDDDDDEEHSETHQGDEEANEESLLLSRNKKEDDTYYKVPSTVPTWIRRAPVLYCLTDPSLCTALLVAFVQAFLLASFDATIPTEAAQLFGFDSLESGLLFLPLGALNFVIGPAAGWAVDKYGTKPAATVGYAWLSIVLVLLRIPHPVDPTSNQSPEIAKYCVILALCGVGLAVIGAPSIVEAGSVVQRYHERNREFFGEGGPYAQLYGLNSMIFSAGLAIGPEAAGGLREKIGYGNMNAVVAALTAGTCVLCFVFLGGKPRILGGRKKSR